MTLTSDPSLRRVEAPPRLYRSSPARRAFLNAPAWHLPTPRRPMAKALTYGALVLTTVSIAVSLIAWAFATPLTTIPAASAPTWSVELSSSSSHPVVALAYGPEAGLHIFRVPGANSSAAPRVIPARLAQGQLHMLSLGWSGLRAHAIAPVGAGAISWSAESRTITAFQDKSGTGVRTSW